MDSNLKRGKYTPHPSFSWKKAINDTEVEIKNRIKIKEYSGSIHDMQTEKRQLEDLKKKHGK